VVERIVAQANIRRDLFHCIDVVAVRRGSPGVLGVQATSLPHVGERVAKVRAQPELAVWLAAGNDFEVWGWTRRNGR